MTHSNFSSNSSENTNLPGNVKPTYPRNWYFGTYYDKRTLTLTADPWNVERKRKHTFKPTPRFTQHNRQNHHLHAARSFPFFVTTSSFSLPDATPTTSFHRTLFLIFSSPVFQSRFHFLSSFSLFRRWWTPTSLWLNNHLSTSTPPLRCTGIPGPYRSRSIPPTIRP